MRQIYLSQAHITQREIDFVVAALNSGWVAPAGPDLEAFELEVSAVVGLEHVVALSSGTAALHLGLKALGVKPGDDVIVPTLTFAATAFAVVHAGATPVFVDVDEHAWGLDPSLLDEVIQKRVHEGRRPAAVIPVDMLGRPADHDGLADVCDAHGVPILVDAAESLGATYRGRPAGSMGAASVFSFNGNKIVTSSGGGAFVTEDPALAEKVRYWSTQAREPQPWYEHVDIGYNYRLSNILAALGRAQLSRLSDIVQRRRDIHHMYSDGLSDIPSLSVLADPPGSVSNNWLTCAVIKGCEGSAEAARIAMASHGIETRRVWKPMHLQPVFEKNAAYLTGVSDRAFKEGLCLPSGNGLSDDDIRRVIRVLHEVL